MLTVSRFEVFSMDLDFLDLFWEIGDTVEDHYKYSFYLQRSESPMGPWDTLGGPFKDRWFFRDITVNLKHRHRKYFYRLHIVEDSTGDELFSEPVFHTPRQDLIAREITMRMALLLREFIGRWVILLPVRTFGTRCPDCWDNIRKRREKDRCITCYGTGYAGGFLHPMQILLNIDPAPDSTQATSSGEILDTKSTGRCLPFPPLKPNDLIVEAENIRWRVMNVAGTQKLRHAVHKEVQLHQIFPGDIAYKIPISVDPLNFDPSPGREFTRPQSEEALGPEEPGIANILAAYGYPFNR